MYHRKSIKKNCEEKTLITNKKNLTFQQCCVSRLWIPDPDSDIETKKSWAGSRGPKFDEGQSGSASLDLNAT